MKVCEKVPDFVVELLPCKRGDVDIHPLIVIQLFFKFFDLTSIWHWIKASKEQAQIEQYEYRVYAHNKMILVFLINVGYSGHAFDFDKGVHLYFHIFDFCLK